MAPDLRLYQELQRMTAFRELSLPQTLTLFAHGHGEKCQVWAVFCLLACREWRSSKRPSTLSF